MSKEEGAPPNQICSQCKRLLEPTWKACPYCGTSIVPRERIFPPVCPRCKSLIQPTWTTCPYCKWNLARPFPPPTGNYPVEEHVSGAWYLVPFLFGIVGGLIAYVGVRDRDQSKAKNLLIFGIVWTFILSILYWAAFYYLISSI
jgi:RNA polymerase subunit RPABC4/transcription elongation factor Spt4